MEVLNIVIRLSIEYAFHVVPFSIPNIRRMEKLLIKLIKIICNLTQAPLIYSPNSLDLHS